MHWQECFRLALQSYKAFACEQRVLCPVSVPQRDKEFSQRSLIVDDLGEEKERCALIDTYYDHSAKELNRDFLFVNLSYADHKTTTL